MGVGQSGVDERQTDGGVVSAVAAAEHTGRGGAALLIGVQMPPQIQK